MIRAVNKAKHDPQHRTEETRTPPHFSPLCQWTPVAPNAPQFTPVPETSRRRRFVAWYSLAAVGCASAVVLESS
jgi:hypothetical protein